MEILVIGRLGDREGKRNHGGTLVVDWVLVRISDWSVVVGLCFCDVILWLDLVVVM